MPKILWSGVKLDVISKVDLEKQLKQILWPLSILGWVQKTAEGNELPDHMTMIPGLPLPPEWKKYLGKEYTLKGTHFGLNDKAAALKVETELPSRNELKHVTVMISPTGRPVCSNDIKSWFRLDNPIELKGKVIEEGV